MPSIVSHRSTAFTTAGLFLAQTYDGRYLSDAEKEEEEGASPDGFAIDH